MLPNAKNLSRKINSVYTLQYYDTENAHETYPGVQLLWEKWNWFPLLKVPRNPSNLAFICTQIGLIHDIFSFFVCKKHYLKK